MLDRPRPGSQRHAHCPFCGEQQVERLLSEIGNAEDALVDALLTVATGQEERRARGRHAQADSRRYGWAEIAPRFASLYEELLASSPGQQVARGRRA